MSFLVLTLSSIAFPRGLWWSQASPPLATKSSLHTTQILTGHPSHHVMCVYAHVPPGLRSPWTPEAVPCSCSLSPSASRVVGFQEICLNEGELRQNEFQRGLWSSALCLACPTSLQPSFLSRTCIIFPNIIVWNLKLFQLWLSSERNRCSETSEKQTNKQTKPKNTLRE